MSGDGARHEHEWIQSEASVAGVYCRWCGEARFKKAEGPRVAAPGRRTGDAG